jgi:hypothetical protein
MEGDTDMTSQQRELALRSIWEQIAVLIAAAQSYESQAIEFADPTRTRYMQMADEARKEADALTAAATILADAEVYP